MAIAKYVFINIFIYVYVHVYMNAYVTVCTYAWMGMSYLYMCVYMYRLEERVGVFLHHSPPISPKQIPSLKLGFTLS